VERSTSWISRLMLIWLRNAAWRSESETEVELEVFVGAAAAAVRLKRLRRRQERKPQMRVSGGGAQRR
jgi:hypothetical protein